MSAGEHGDPHLLRWIGLWGLVGVACTTASAPLMPIWGFPGTGASSRAVSDFVVSHHDRLVAGMVLNVFGVMLWLVLAAGVWSRVQSRSDANDPAANCFAIGFVALATLLLTGFLIFVVFVTQSPRNHDASLLYNLAFGLLAVSGAPTAIAMTAFAVSASRTRAFSTPTIALAGLAAAAHVVLVLSPFLTRGFFSLEGQIITAAPGTLFLWLLAAGLELTFSKGLRRVGADSSRSSG